MIESGGRRVGSTFLVQLLAKPLSRQTDLFDGLAALGRLNQHGLDGGAFRGIELAEHEGGQPRIVRIDGHGQISSLSSRLPAACRANN